MQGQPTPEKILQTGLAFWASKTLLSAIEMGGVHGARTRRLNLAVSSRKDRARTCGILVAYWVGSRL
jgi:hypothetical protein